MALQIDGYCTRTLWKYFFPPEKYSLHEVCASARYENHSVLVLCWDLDLFFGRTSNGVLSSTQPRSGVRIRQRSLDKIMGN